MTFGLSFRIHFCEICASYTIDFKQMSKISSRRGNEFLQPARVDYSLGNAAGLYRCSSWILVPQLCKGQILNVFSFGLVFGATAALGCGQDRETGALLSPPRNAFDLISAPQHNYWHADCSAPVGRITVAVLDGAVLLSLNCSNQSLLTSGWTKVHDRFGQLSQSCVCLPFFFVFPFDTKGKYVIWVWWVSYRWTLMQELKAKQGPSFYGD